ncbi:MAG: apolipoprotein N-acyltransferase [Deltaproteobacteria bacterium]|nr:apolipoprotein N-acyltransferase [Deltaproteobacteria bacterium]
MEDARPNSTSKAPALFCFLSIVILGAAWLIPGTPYSAALGWIAALGLASFQNLTYRPFAISYVASVAAHGLAFHWLFFTIRDFGGFTNFPAISIYALFLLVSALHFPIYVLFLKRMPAALKRLGLAVPIAWIGAEFLSIRIFPWYLGHTQIAFAELAQIADIAGAATISFLMMWLASSVYELLRSPSFRISPLFPVLLLCGSYFYGKMRIGELEERPFPTQKVALIQANISVEQKHNIKMFTTNVGRYIELSQKVVQPGLLVVWPETVIHEWLFAGLKHAESDPRRRLPFFDNAALLVGALTFEDRERFFNSAIGIKAGGEIAGVYHKQILMPFGEYTPFGDWFPWLKEVNSTVADFTAGREIRVVDLGPINGDSLGTTNVKAAPLICYEDLLPSLGRSAAQKGANLLVNLTNDAWFGDSAAPIQHHVIASFRSIETRRALLRATNTGLTAVVDAAGRTTETLPKFSDGTIVTEVRLVDQSTVFTAYLGEKPWWILSIFCLVSVLFPRSRKGRR